MDPRHNPSAGPDTVCWKFRFEWCTGDHPTPWWSSTSEPDRTNPPADEHTKQAYTISGLGTSDSTTVQRGYRFDQLLSHRSLDQSSEYSHQCLVCCGFSEKVYQRGKICMNEACPWFFLDASISGSEFASLIGRKLKVKQIVSARPTVPLVRCDLLLGLTPSQLAYS